MDTMYETATKVEPVPQPKKRFEQNRGDFEEWDSSRDGSSRSGSPPPSTGKRKMCSDREPESPTDLDPHQPTPPYSKREKSMYPRERMETDSPSSYPRHVLVPSDEHHDQRQTQLVGAHPESTPSRKVHNTDSTPTLTPESVSMASGGGGGNNAGFEPHYYRPQYYGSDPYHHNGGRGNPNFPPEVDLGHYGRGSGQSDNVYLRPSPSPKRWACDYCNVATFLSYEEACAHEEQCARRHQDHYARLNPRPPMRSFGDGNGNGLASLYHAAQQDRCWSARAGPPMPMLPSEKGYRMHQPPHQGYGDYRGRYEMDEYGYHQHHQPHQREPEQRRGMLLSLSTDSDSLSDRQCYVRTTMVEIFAASEKDVAARHTKGAQKLAVGQVGIRCVYCSHLRPRDRAERAVCYPSSISRIYQTVADMQRFHFEQCSEIPSEVRDIYKSLKTTRPRGVGSPQTYWVQSAKILGLTDSENGIRFQESENNNNANKQQTDMSV